MEYSNEECNECYKCKYRKACEWQWILGIEPECLLNRQVEEKEELNENILDYNKGVTYV